MGGGWNDYTRWSAMDERARMGSMNRRGRLSGIGLDFDRPPPGFEKDAEKERKGWGESVRKALDNEEKAIRQSMANAISGAIITGFDQGGKVAVTQFVKMLRNKMIENLMSSLMQGLGGVFGGGPLGFLFGSAKA